MKSGGRILIYPLLILMFVIFGSSSFGQKQVDNNHKPVNPVQTAGTVRDKDGNIYKTVTIGSQVWMAENLRSTKFRNGDPVPNVSANASWSVLKSGAYCLYNNDAANKSVYGTLYNWFVVTDPRNIAPAGWHIPSDEEWTALTNFLQGNSQAGGKLKETGTSHWSDPNSGAINSTGFTALPGGYRAKDGVFKNLSLCGTWWATTEYTQSVAWYRYVDYGTGNIYRVSIYKACGLSIRCIKD
jgi:uncharacterized protein (TIGR02145 family)